MRRPALAIVLFCLYVSIPAQKFQYAPVSSDIILDRVENAPLGNEQRHTRLKQLFVQAGCYGPALTEQPVAGPDTANIICRLQGSSDESIIVGAPYEQPSTRQARDGWSAAALLPSLYQSLTERKRRHTVVFIAFAAEANGPNGAELYAKNMTPNEIQRTEAMLSLQELGHSPTKVWTGHSDRDLVQALVVVTYALKLPLSQVDVDNDWNSEAFAARQIPRITVHSLTAEDVWSGRAATFRPNNYVDSYRLLGGYLAYLDTVLKPKSEQRK
ncbi:MAG TPA: M28 family peptidase [Candidatus Angelobacter sp.]|nr:M28 family peptidase [Candidatus Angelobacter sp.]